MTNLPGQELIDKGIEDLTQDILDVRKMVQDGLVQKEKL